MAESDISIEPLLNQSGVGAGADKKVAFVPIDTVGVATNRSVIAVSNTRQEITITAGHRTIELHNKGDGTIYYGGSNVTSSNGIQLFQNSTKPFGNVRSDFSVYVVADGAETPELRIVEYT